jgi:hypothetical protein
MLLPVLLLLLLLLLHCSRSTHACGLHLHHRRAAEGIVTLHMQQACGEVS